MSCNHSDYWPETLYLSLTIQSAVLCLLSYLHVNSTTVNKSVKIYTQHKLSWSTTWAHGPWTISFLFSIVFIFVQCHLVWIFVTWWKKFELFSARSSQINFLWAEWAFNLNSPYNFRTIDEVRSLLTIENIEASDYRKYYCRADDGRTTKSWVIQLQKGCKFSL
jgi:hypothetical protein